MSKRPIKFIMVQNGFCVFGAGHTRDACLRDACHWLEPDEHGPYTPVRIENELLSSGRRQHGGFSLLEGGDDEFGSYLRNHGGFRKTAHGNWVAE